MAVKSIAFIMVIWSEYIAVLGNIAVKTKAFTVVICTEYGC